MFGCWFQSIHCQEGVQPNLPRPLCMWYTLVAVVVVVELLVELPIGK